MESTNKQNENENESKDVQENEKKRKSHIVSFVSFSFTKKFPMIYGYFKNLP